MALKEKILLNIENTQTRLIELYSEYNKTLQESTLNEIRTQSQILYMLQSLLNI
jgi:hypothetical protein